MLNFIDKLFFSSNVKRIYKQNSSNTNQSNFLDPSFSITPPTREESEEIIRMINNHIDKLIDDGKKVGDIIADTTIGDQTYYRIKEDYKHDQKPEKLTLIKLGLGAELNLDLLIKLLYNYGFCLNNKYLPDIICEQFFINWIYEKHERGKAVAVNRLLGYFKKFNIDEKVLKY